MGRLYVSEPEAYTGKFDTWQHHLRSNIKATQSDYDENDPRTWPCLQTTDYTQRYPGVTYRPPSRVAYSIDCLLGLFQDKNIGFDLKVEHYWGGGAKKNEKHWRFQHWPYNFTRDGEVRHKVGIPKADYEAWMLQTNGISWQAKYPPKETASQKAPKMSKPEAQKDPIHQDKDNSNIAATGTHGTRGVSTAFDNIMNSLDTHAATQSTINTLENTIVSLKDQLSNSTKTAEAAQEQVAGSELRLRSEKNRTSEAEKGAAIVRTQLQNEVNAKKLQKASYEAAAEKLIKEKTAATKKAQETQERERKAKEGEQTAKDEAKTAKEREENARDEERKAKEQVEQIWQKMQNLQRAAAGKRKADTGPEGAQEKQPKIRKGM